MKLKNGPVATGDRDWAASAIGKIRSLIAQREYSDAATELTALLANMKTAEVNAEKQRAAAAAGKEREKEKEKEDDKGGDEEEEKVVLPPPPAHQKAAVLHLRALLAWNHEKDRASAVQLLTECLQQHQSSLADRAPDYEFYIALDPDWLLIDLMATAYPMLFVTGAAAQSQPQPPLLRTLYLHLVESLNQLRTLSTGWPEVGVALARCHWAGGDEKAVTAYVVLPITLTRPPASTGPLTVM